MTKEEIQKEIDNLMAEREVVHKSIMKALHKGNKRLYRKEYAKRAEIEAKINELQDSMRYV